MIPKPGEIERAREVLRQFLEPTRLVAADSLTRRTGARVFLKLRERIGDEFVQAARRDLRAAQKCGDARDRRSRRVEHGESRRGGGIRSAAARNSGDNFPDKSIRIVGVQAAQAPSYFLSLKQGRTIATETCDTIADGLATRTPLEENVRAIRELVDEVRLVSEEEMLDAMRLLQREENVTAEPAGAAATAALLQIHATPTLPKAKGGAPTDAGKNVVLLVTGANAPGNETAVKDRTPGVGPP
jgi:threonine dehydratase